MRQNICKTLLVLFAILSLSLGAPAIYNQQQDGNTNVRADLQNIMIIVATSRLPAMSLLSDFATEIGLRKWKSNGEQDAEEDPADEVEPELSQKVEIVQVNLDELEKKRDQAADEGPRKSRNVVLQNLRSGSQQPAIAADLGADSVDSNDVQKSPIRKQQELVLLGDGIENCGPGRVRDNEGLCQDDKFSTFN